MFLRGAGAGTARPPRLQRRTQSDEEPATSSVGSSRRPRERTTSCAWRWRRVERAPAAGGASAGGVSGAAGDGGGGVPGLTDAVRHRRAAAAAGGVAGLRGRRGDIEGPSPPGWPPFNALRIRRAT